MLVADHFLEILIILSWGGTIMAHLLESSTGNFAMVMSSISCECSDDRREHLQVIKKSAIVIL